MCMVFTSKFSLLNHQAAVREFPLLNLGAVVASNLLLASKLLCKCQVAYLIYKTSFCSNENWHILSDLAQTSSSDIASDLKVTWNEVPQLETWQVMKYDKRTPGMISSPS